MDETQVLRIIALATAPATGLIAGYFVKKWMSAIEKQLTKQDELAETILSEVQKINGRVRDLEAYRLGHELWARELKDSVEKRISRLEDTWDRKKRGE